MRTRPRPAYTLFHLLVLLTILALLFALLLPLLARLRAEALRAQKLNNLKQIGLACHSHHDAYTHLPAGNDDKNFSAAAKLLPFVEQNVAFQQIDFMKPMDDKANAAARKLQVTVYLSPQDPVNQVTDEYGATNYLYCAGSKPALKDNDGMFYQDSKVRLLDVTDGTSNTIMVGETLKGEKSKEMTVRRQHVLLGKGELANLKDESGVDDFKNGKNVAHDRCASWMDGRFLQGTFTATRLANDERPDVSCDGLGGLSALRSVDDKVSVGFADGSVRTMNARKVTLEVWKALATRAGGEVVPADF